MSRQMSRGFRVASAALLGLFVSTAGGAVLGPVASAAAVSVAASADSYVSSAAPTTNYGTRQYVLVDGSPEQVAYLRFDIPAGTDMSAGVQLRIFAESSHSTGVTVHRVDDTSWTETGIAYANRPAVGTASVRTGRLTASTWAVIDVAPLIGTSTGPVSLALQPTSTTAEKITSREGVNKPELIIGSTAASNEFQISPVGDGTYQAVGSTTYTGTLKSVGERAVADLMAAGGGTVRFTAGTFDFGAEWFKFYNLHDITFVGAGMDATVLTNNTDLAADTEPFNMTGTNRVTVRDMTVNAGGAPRTTSDALDFDQGNNSTIENVRVTGSRARGIVFDGKDAGATADGNTIRNCQISGIPGTGIELLASGNNTITGCTITNTGGVGILAKAASAVAAQPNKKSSGNTITGNTVDEAGTDGIAVLSSDRNQVLNNTVTNSSDVTAGRDGIRIYSSNNVTCDDNVVRGNTATDNQAVKTQTYGLNIVSSLCNRTVVGADNNFAGNRVGTVKNVGTGTIFE
jgi:parallel beta-helix repeat protein